MNNTPKYRNEICMSRHWGDLCISRNKITITTQKTNKLILIVLESPHYCEYADDSGNFVGKGNIYAAMGPTGRNLDDKLIHYLTEYQKASSGIKSIPDGEYRVVIENAVPYQCSRGEDTLHYRDENWLRCWYECGQHLKFRSLVTNYRPDVIINMATKGLHYIKYGNDTETITPLYLESLGLPNQDYGKDIIDKQSGETLYLGKYTKKGMQSAVKEAFRAYKKTNGVDEYYIKGFVQTAIDFALRHTNSTLKLISSHHPSSRDFCEDKAVLINVN
jgi:hypothetical protein